MLEALHNMLDKGNDNALLRFGLGKGYLDVGDAIQAAEHLRVCVIHDPNYSAAWKLLGHAHEHMGQLEEASKVWTEGLQVAQRRGDKQAEKEMNVFLRRLAKLR